MYENFHFKKIGLFEVFNHCDLLLKKIKSITKKLQVAHSHIFGLLNEWTTQNSSLGIMKILKFFFCEFAPIERMEQQDKIGSESDSNWKKIYMQISVLSFTWGYDPKLGISQHLRTRYIFFAARGK